MREASLSQQHLLFFIIRQNLEEQKKNVHKQTQTPPKHVLDERSPTTSPTKKYFKKRKNIKIFEIVRKF